MTGNGTIGLEILEDLPEVEAIIAPFGGGGNICGVASAIKAIKPNVKVRNLLVYLLLCMSLSSSTQPKICSS